MSKVKWLSREEKSAIYRMVGLGASSALISESVGRSVDTVNNFIYNNSLGGIRRKARGKTELIHRNRSENVVYNPDLKPCPEPSYTLTVGKDHLLRRLRAGLR